jgi:hypothetical protein
VTSKPHRIAIGLCCYDRARTDGWGLNLTQPSTQSRWENCPAAPFSLIVTVRTVPCKPVSRHPCRMRRDTARLWSPSTGQLSIEIIA